MRSAVDSLEIHLGTLLDPHGRLSSDPRFMLNETPIQNPQYTYQIHAPVSALLKEADESAQAVSELLSGEPVAVVDEDGEWCAVKSFIDGYTGWISRDDIEPIERPATHRVCASLTHVYAAPHLKSAPIGMLPMGALVALTDTPAQSRFRELHDSSGWVFESHCLALGENLPNPLDVAQTFIDTPYLWGGRSKLGIDCSGLVQISLAMTGLRTHRDSSLQSESLGTPVPKNEAAQAGDLAFFPGHVGWMMDSDYILHANATHMAVTIDKLDDVVERIAEDLEKRGIEKDPFSGFRRL